MLVRGELLLLRPNRCCRRSRSSASRSQPSGRGCAGRLHLPGSPPRALAAQTKLAAGSSARQQLAISDATERCSYRLVSSGSDATQDEGRRSDACRSRPVASSRQVGRALARAGRLFCRKTGRRGAILRWTEVLWVVCLGCVEWKKSRQRHLLKITPSAGSRARPERPFQSRMPELVCSSPTPSQSARC